MTRSLQKIGNSKGFIMTRDMLDHIGVADQVEVDMIEGHIVISAPTNSKSVDRQTFEEAKRATIDEYREALRVLSPNNGATSNIPAKRSNSAGWPDNYFDQTYGSTANDRLERQPQGDFEVREILR